MKNSNQYSKKIIRSKLITEINIIPIVDIILVLLIIFMIAAPNLYSKKETQLQVDLPNSQVSDENVATKSLSIQILNDNELLFDGTVYDQIGLTAILKKNENLENAEITINADKKADHGTVINIVGLIRKIGFEKIFIGVKKMTP